MKVKRGQITNNANIPKVQFTQPLKSVGTAYLFWAILGVVGGHKFYLNRTGMGIFYILTGGGFLIGVFCDLFTLASQVRNANNEMLINGR